MHLKYSVVVATRNRPQALQLSLPRIITQTRPPSQLIVVDSSDDPKPTEDVFRESVAGANFEVSLLQNARGLCAQRNAGLRLVAHPVVFLPDDDSIFFPDTAEQILRAYERADCDSVAAVCAAEAKDAPGDFLPVAKKAYSMNSRDRIVRYIGRMRTRIEDKLFPDPVRVIARDMYRRFPLPASLAANDIVPVEWMTGFRMSYRTEVIRKSGFDESFKRYCLFEDREASLQAWQHGAVVAARNAKIFHYRSPERRDAGRRIGAEQLLNLGYITAKHSHISHPARAALLRFARYKTFIYSLSKSDDFARDRYDGARAALAQMPALAQGDQNDAARIYRESLERCGLLC